MQVSQQRFSGTEPVITFWSLLVGPGTVIVPQGVSFSLLIKTAGRNIKNLRYADDTTLMAESEEELETLDESERGE